MIGRNSHATDYCKENLNFVEGYREALKSEEEYVCHHRLETHIWDSANCIWVKRNKGEALTSSQLKELNLYFNRPADELIFMRRKEHNSLHRLLRENKPHSDETKKKISESCKKIVRTEEWNRKNSEGCKRRHTHHVIYRGTVYETRELYSVMDIRMNICDLNGYCRKRGYVPVYNKDTGKYDRLPVSWVD